MAFGAVQTWLSALPKKKEGILAIDLLRCALVDLLHPPSNNSFQPPSKNHKHKGVVSYMLQMTLCLDWSE
jgi:hypothetical protein